MKHNVSKPNGKPNKSQSAIIRDWMKANPGVSKPRDVHAGLHAAGQEVSLSLVQTVVYQKRKRKSGRKAQQPAERASVSFDTLRRFQEFSKAEGGIEPARRNFNQLADALA